MSEVRQPCATGRCAPGFYQGAPGCLRCQAVERSLTSAFRHVVATNAALGIKPYDPFKLPDLKPLDIKPRYLLPGGER